MLSIFLDLIQLSVPVETKGTLGTCVVASACFLSSQISSSHCTLSCSYGERKFNVSGFLSSSSWPTTVVTEGALSSKSMVINFTSFYFLFFLSFLPLSFFASSTFVFSAGGLLLAVSFAADVGSMFSWLLARNVDCFFLFVFPIH